MLIVLSGPSFDSFVCLWDRCARCATRAPHRTPTPALTTWQNQTHVPSNSLPQKQPFLRTRRDVLRRRPARLPLERPCRSARGIRIPLIVHDSARFRTRAGRSTGQRLAAAWGSAPSRVWLVSMICRYAASVSSMALSCSVRIAVFRVMDSFSTFRLRKGAGSRARSTLGAARRKAAARVRRVAAGTRAAGLRVDGVGAQPTACSGQQCRPGWCGAPRPRGGPAEAARRVGPRAGGRARRSGAGTTCAGKKQEGLSPGRGSPPASP